MSQSLTLACLALFVFALNLPFGSYRAGVRKFSLRWFLAIHLPIPVVFLTRRYFGFGLSAIPIFVAADVAGQVVGSRFLPFSKIPFVSGLFTNGGQEAEA